MNYREAIEYIERAEVFGSKLGLESITELTRLLGNPQENIKFVHVAGTNAKGSVSSFIANILTEAGYKTGLFTSPHVERFSERIIIDGVEITEESVASSCGLVRDEILNMVSRGFPQPTEFEIVTALALVYFNRQKCDIVVLEVGLGGRLDATNVIDVPEAAVITAIDYDHTSVLGGSLAEIAFEKAGIVKQGGVVATCRQKPEAMHVIESVCAERGATLYVADTGIIADDDAGSPDALVFDCGIYKNLKISLLGVHQAANASLAIKAVEILNRRGWNISENALRNGLLKAKWPGRFEIIRKNPTVIIDGAHNPHGAAALAQSLTRYFGDKKMLFIMGVLADKNYTEMLEYVTPLASCFYTVTPDSPRALPAPKLAETIRSLKVDAESFESVSGAIGAALGNINENEVICCFGSLYFIGEARTFLINTDGN